MLKSKESLEWVCETLMNDIKIPHVVNPYDLNNREQNTIIEINRRMSKKREEHMIPNYAAEIEVSSPRRSSSPRKTIGVTTFGSPKRIQTSSPKNKRSSVMMENLINASGTKLTQKTNPERKYTLHVVKKPVNPGLSNVNHDEAAYLYQ